MTINISENRLRRLVEAGRAAHEQVKAAAGQVQACRASLREAEHELHRHEGNGFVTPEKIAALRGAVETARVNIRDAVERHAAVSRDAADAQRLAGRIREFAAARSLNL